LSINQSELAPQFKFELTAMPGGELLKRCFECGACTGICPVSAAEPAFDPRKILHMIKLGLKQQLLRSELLWYCTHCDFCAFSCPQEIRFSMLVDALRELAVKEGYADSGTFHLLGTAPCKETCPAHISIPGFIGAIARGRYAEGLRLIKEEMPFPAICGRVCPHPCEAKCNRGLLDQPAAIMALKRFLADQDLASGTAYIPEKKKAKSARVAIIGAGPAGLTAAYYLALEGYPVTVFEKLPVAGGMMAVGIPEYRLPRNILQAEIEGVERLGVEIKRNCEIGKDVTFADLRRDFQAVFIGVGCHRSLKLGIAGESGLDGVVDGLSFLQQINLGKPSSNHGRVVVVGGGNAAIDCARVAKRLDYKSVTLLYRRSREEMPANPREVEEALEEGVDIQFLSAPVELVGESQRLKHLRCLRMQLGEPDGSGRRRPIPLEGSEFEIPADILIAAIGQIPDLSFLSGPPFVPVSRLDLIEADAVTGATDIPGVFAGGDVVSGPWTVVGAVALGKAAALSIHRYLRGEDMKAGREKQWRGIPLSPDGMEPQERVPMPQLFLGDRKRSFKEIELGFDELQAQREATRCLRVCGMQKRTGVP
jgi:NADPH-dependent glutamate synthase beta subunit-like oxidoreductase